MSEALEPEVAAEPDDEAPATAPQSAAEADPAPSAEDRALTMGWTPKEQFKGDPEKWVDAETFVKRGEEFLPFLKANNRRLEQEREKDKKQIERLEKAVKSSIEHMSKADARAYERAKRELEGQLDQAAQAGDAAGVRAVTKELVDLEKDAAKAKPDLDANGWTPDFAEAVSDWKAANPWYGTDRAMTAFAHDLERELVERNVPDKQRLKQMAEGVRAEFAHKFTNPRREQASTVEGASMGQRKAAKGYSDLPADARQMCDELVRDKIITREKYISEYFK
jgi:hypothetical protein